MIREVLKMGDPCLARRTSAVPAHAFGSEALRKLAADLGDTLAARGGIGLAAPQIGVSLRVIAFGIPHHLSEPDSFLIPQTVLVNPTISVLGDALEDDWEGCLSLPGLRGVVPRPARIRYSGFTIEGEPLERTAEGYHARVVLHEADHLDGVLYPARIRDWSRFGFVDALFPKS